MVGRRPGRLACIFTPIWSVPYARLGEVEKAAAMLRQAKAIGEQIGDPRIVQVTTDALAKLS